jgi:hypothetical protein
METTILDEAFRLLLARDIPISHENLYVDLGKRRIRELERRFPGGDVETASHRADELLAVACELVDLSRGPRNDHKGPPVDLEVLAARCPGFSRELYDAACSEAYLLTR